MSEIYFIRHGQASALSEDYDNLSELGARQSKRTGHFMAQKLSHCDKIYYGPLKRHRQTLEHFQEGWQQEKKNKNEADLILLEGLEEHQGYRIVKSILPQMITEDEEIQRLASIPFDNREEQIQNYIRIYEKMSINWIKGDYHHIAKPHETWEKFRQRSSRTLEKIKDDNPSSEIVLIITSGGPISCSVASSLSLSSEKNLEVSWNIHNCSISKFHFERGRFSLSSFNSTEHFSDLSMITLV